MVTLALKLPGAGLALSLVWATAGHSAAMTGDCHACLYRPYIPIDLVDGVHMLTNPPDHAAFASSNVVIIEQRDGLVVIDSGTDRGDGDAIVRYIRSLSTKPVKALLFTHWHNDHLQGASQLLKAWPKMRIIATATTAHWIDGPSRDQGFGLQPSPKADAGIVDQIDQSIAQMEKMAASKDIDAATRIRVKHAIAQFRSGRADVAGTRLIPPTETFTDRLLIDDPDRPVELHYLGRANTDGDAIAWLPNQKLVATGDVVVSPVPFGFGSYPADWIATLDKLKALGPTVIIPGHGLPMSDTSYIDRLSASIAAIRAAVAPLVAKGFTLEQVREKIDLAALRDTYWTGRRGASAEALWLTPMIENAYKEAKGIPIKQDEPAR